LLSSSIWYNNPMKIDLYAPKKLYGAHVMAFSGWLVVLLYELFFPMNGKHCGTGIGICIAFMFLVYIWFLMVIMIIFTIDKFTKKRVTKPFFLHNLIYDIFFDAGIVLMLTPFFWFGTDCVMSIKNIIPLVLIFLLIRGLKRNQRIREKQQKS